MTVAPVDPGTLRPRLAPGIVARYVAWRGAPGFMLLNPATGRYLRAEPRAWALLARLDGRRTLAEALSGLPPANDGEPDDETLGDALPGLAVAGIVDIPGWRPPPLRTRVAPLALLQGAMVSRVRLGDLAGVLARAGPLLESLYGRAGLLLVPALWLLAAWLWAGRGDLIVDQAARLADPGLADLLAWYAMFVASKLLHELGHAAALSRLARAEAHQVGSFPFGLSFMFLLPAPYVDVSATWFLGDRWRRAAVGMAGIWMDLLVAGLAASFAALLAQGALRDRLCELVLLAGLASLLFNANPLVRLDGYYVLSDLLELPNLQPRAQAALQAAALWLFGGAAPGRVSLWLMLYGLLAMAYRFIIFTGVFWLAGDVHWGLAMAVAMVVGMLYLALPAFRGILVLSRTRGLAPTRLALGTTALVGAAAAVVLLPLPRGTVAHGVVWNESLALVFAGADGRVSQVAAARDLVPASGTLVQLDNPETRRIDQQLALEAAGLLIEQRRAAAGQPQRLDSISARLDAVADQRKAIAAEVAAWRIAGPAGARWEPLAVERLEGAWVRRDDRRPLGAVIGDGPTVIRLVLDQWQGPLVLEALAAQPGLAVPVRRFGEAVPVLLGVAQRVRPDAREELPSLALALPNGGPFALRAGAAGTATAERVFELRLQPQATFRDGALLHGGRVEAWIELPPAPLSAQVWQYARRLFQQRIGA